MSSNEFGENSTLVAKSCLQIIAEESDDEASGLSGFGVLKDRADWQNKESFGFSTDTLGKSLEGTFLESPLKAALDAPNHFDSRPKPNGKHSQIARKPAPKGDERFQKSNIKNELGNGLSTTNEASTVFWKMDLPNVHEGREATIDDDCELDTNAKSNKPLILNGTHSGDYDNAISRSWKGVGDLSIQDPGTIKPSSQSNKAPILSGGSSQTLKTTSNDSFEDIIKEKSQRRGKWFNLREIPILKNLYKDSKQGI